MTGDPTNPLPMVDFAPFELTNVAPHVAQMQSRIRELIGASAEGVVRQARLHRIAAEALQEVQRAEAKHGRQSGIPDGTGPDVQIPQVQGRIEPVAVTNHEWAQRCKYDTDKNAHEGRVTRLDILLEEVAEASAEDALPVLREELIQVIAMGIAWVADIDERS